MDQLQQVLQRINQIDRRVNDLQQRSHTATGEVAGSSAYYRPADGSLRTPGAIYPGGRLHVQNTGTDPASGEGVEILYIPTSSLGHVFAYDRSTSSYLELQVSGNPLLLRNSSNTMMYVASSGVGMSTSNPRGMLEISGGDLIIANKSQWFGLPLFEGSGGWARGIYFFDNEDDPPNASTAQAGFGILGNQDTWSRMWWTFGGNPWNSVEGIVLMNVSGAARVGIGTTGPSFKFDVKSNIDNYVARFWNDGNLSSRRVLLIQGGQYTNPSHTAIAFLDGDGGTIGSITGNGSGGVAFNTTSDERKKQDITPLADSLKRVLALEPVTYRGKGQGTETQKQPGLIAQQVRKIMPELVTEDDEGFLSLNYIGIVPYLVAGFQELHQRVQKLESKND